MPTEYKKTQKVLFILLECQKSVIKHRQSNASHSETTIHILRDQLRDLFN